VKEKTFRGGYSFKRFVGQPSEELAALAVPRKVMIPLAQGFGSPLEPQVKVGDKVAAGQIIARDDSKISSPIHASISGKVVGIEKRNYFKREVTMVMIEGDGAEDFQRLEGYSSNWEKLPSELLEELLYKSGVTSLDRQGIPTRFKSSLISPREVEDLIIHGIESEAYNTSLEVLLRGKGLYAFVEGIKILKTIMPQAKVHLALNRNRKEIIERVKKLTTNLENFNLYPLAPKYPQGYDEVLVPTLLGKKFPYGYSAANIGIIILNVQAVLQVFEAVAEGKPLIERTVALCGPSFKRPRHLKVRVGTPLNFLLKDELREGPVRVVMNSLLTGPELKDLSLSIDRTFMQIIALPEGKERELLAFLRSGLNSDSYSRTFLSNFFRTPKQVTTNRYGEERPCIQCGYCLEVCPVGILPTLLDRYRRLGINETLMRYGIFNCIECNLCSYVCPSKITLAENLKNAKAKLIEIGCDHSLCILPKFNLIGLEEYKGVKATR